MIQSITFLSPKQNLLSFTIEREIEDCNQYLQTLRDGTEYYGFVKQYLDNLQEFPKVKDTTSIPRGLLLNRYSRRAG